MAKLFVIFHGSWAFVDNHDDPRTSQICACATDTDAHTYIGFSWLAEMKIRRNTSMTLSGVSTDGTYWLRDPNNAGTFILFPKQSGCPRTTPYVRVYLPRPTTVHAEMPLPNVAVQINNTPAPPVTFALVPVFEYAIPDGDTPTLTYENPVPSGGSATFWQPTEVSDVTILHLYAADDNTDGKDLSGDFNDVGTMLGSSSASIASIQPPLPDCRQVRTKDLEPFKFEVTTLLHERIHYLRSVGSQMEKGGVEGLKWGTALPPIGGRAARLFAADYASCGGGGGGS